MRGFISAIRKKERFLHGIPGRNFFFSFCLIVQRLCLKIYFVRIVCLSNLVTGVVSSSPKYSSY